MRFFFNLLQTKKSFPLEQRQKIHGTLLGMLWSQGLQQSDLAVRKEFAYRIRSSQHFVRILKSIFGVNSVPSLRGSLVKMQVESTVSLDRLVIYFGLLLQYPAFIPLAFQSKNSVIIRPKKLMQFYENYRSLFFVSLKTLKILFLLFNILRVFQLFNQSLQPFAVNVQRLTKARITI